jgi:glycerol-3-phosphate acyltransferase PlsX
MGGDFAPKEVIDGAYLAVKELDVKIILVGPLNILENEIKRFKDWPANSIVLHEATEVVTMGESPSNSFRKKKNSSIRVGLNLVKEKKADAFVSAGNTGAVMTASLLVLGKVKNIDRPAITAILPTKQSRAVVLDMGSTVDCKASHLAEFAQMGNIFSKHILQIDHPKVGLLNIGEEEEKGNSVTQEAYSIIKGLDLNFVGNIEGKDIFEGKADVVVCDGFVGNSLLKFGEGVVDLISTFFKSEAKKSLLSLVGLCVLSPAFKRFRKRFDYAEYGGAPLLGVNGVSVVAHGKSHAVAIKNAIYQAKLAVENKVIERIEGVR